MPGANEWVRLGLRYRGQAPTFSHHLSGGLGGGDLCRGGLVGGVLGAAVLGERDVDAVNFLSMIDPLLRGVSV